MSRIDKLKKSLMIFLLVLLSTEVLAEILNRNTNWLRIRLGSNNRVDTITYNAINGANDGVPTELGSLSGVTSDNEIIGTANANGSSGIFNIRIVTDVNARNFASAPLTGTFSYDSSNPMSCITPATCGSESISFTKIRWNMRDNDTLNTVQSYDGSANQVFQVQTDTSGSTNSLDARHRNHYQFVFINDTLYPAGTYQGTVFARGTAQ